MNLAEPRQPEGLLLSFEDFVNEYNSENETTPNLKIEKILNLLGLNINTFLTSSKFTTKDGIVNLHPTNGTHWVAFVNKVCSGFCGFPPPNLSTASITKKMEKGFSD